MRRHSVVLVVIVVFLLTAVGGGYAVIADPATPAPTPTSIPTLSPTASPTATPTATSVPTLSPTASPTAAPTAKPSPSPTPTRMPPSTPVRIQATATSTPLVPATPTRKPGEELQIAPELQGKVEGTFSYQLSSDSFIFQLTARNLSQNTITGMTIQYCLANGDYAYCFSSHSLPSGRLKLAPNESSLVFQNAKVGFGTDPAKYGRELSDVASKVASNASLWKVRIKILSVVFQ